MHDLIPPKIVGALQQVKAHLGQAPNMTAERPLRLHDTATILLPTERIVARIAPVSKLTRERAARALRLTDWLYGQGFPTVRPAILEPIAVPEYIITLWHQVPEQPTHSVLEANTALGRLLRELHRLPDPPFTLPTVDPLARLRAALAVDAHRSQPILATADTEFLEHQVEEFSKQYAEMQFPLGHGLIHNDAHAGNVLADETSPYGYLLIDWEGACLGPREMDLVLVGAPGSRFGDTEAERSALCTGYGFDIGAWPGHTMLRAVRDLHSLAAYIRIGHQDPRAIREVRIRIDSLRNEDRNIRWSTV